MHSGSNVLDDAGYAKCGVVHHTVMQAFGLIALIGLLAVRPEFVGWTVCALVALCLWRSASRP